MFSSNRDGYYDIWLQEVDQPIHSYQAVGGSASDNFPDLGSPTMQTERVLTGPAGSDWGGGNPMWSSAAAGIVAYGGNDYLNFVCMGVATAHLASIEITPLEPGNAAVTSALVGATNFAAVFDASGNRIAGAASSVTISGDAMEVGR